VIITIASWIGMVLIGIGGLLAVIRIIRGPTVLDRIIGSDVLLAIVLCVLAFDMAVNKHFETLPVLLVLALFAISGSVAVARFLPGKDDT
jgi:multicomponent Na+:H+ antiporter subunit F